MIRKAADCPIELRENMRGGDGTVEITNFVTKDELYQKGTVSAGDVAVTPKGHGHSVINETDSDVELIALIVYA